MAEQISFTASSTRAERYTEVIPQIEAVIQGEYDLVANLANTAAILKEVFDFFWVGFYLVKGNSLVLGPFQGPLACTRIAKGKGVCGTAWEEKKTLIVEDVDLFPGHIACSSASKSEIVVPVMLQDQVVAVLDIDSDMISDFSDIDSKYLKLIARLLEESFKQAALPK